MGKVARKLRCIFKKRNLFKLFFLCPFNKGKEWEK